MTYQQIIERLGLTQICLRADCGLTARARRRGTIDGFGVVHWQERPRNKRGLRHFLLLVAKRNRLASPNYLNTPDLFHFALYLDQRRADLWAEQLGVRFPIAYSLPERRTVALVPGLSRTHPAIWAWARRGVRV